MPKNTRKKMKTMYDPERPVDPPEIPEKTVLCPVCGGPAREFYLSFGEIFGCDLCVKHDLIDDVLNIPEDQPIPKCKFCHESEQSVYLDNAGNIRACVNCVQIKDARSVNL